MTLVPADSLLPADKAALGNNIPREAIALRHASQLIATRLNRRSTDRLAVLGAGVDASVHPARH